MILGGLVVVTVCVLIKYFAGDKPATADSSSQQSAASQPADSPSPPPPTSSSNLVQRAWFGMSAGGKAPAKSAVVPASAVGPAAAGVVPAISSGKTIPQVVATINGRQITADELGRECILHHGKEVLESMINRQLIVLECERQHITITRSDVDREIQRMAKRFGLPVDQWLALLKQERNIDVEQYASDIIWPSLALGRLAGPRLNVTPDELQQYFEMCHGEKVAARLISCADPKLAEKVRAQAAAHPEDFAKLAKRYSEDVNSASIGGLVQPIHRHGAYKEIERAAFSLADGEVSKVIAAGGQYVILKRENLLPPDKVRLEDVAPKLKEILREKKIHAVASVVFDELKKRAVIEVVLDEPQKQQQMPGIAAVINGARITIRQLAEECIARHGAEVLEGSIGRRLIEQACQERHVTVGERELDDEVTRVASIMFRALPDGSPDVQGFLKMIVQEKGVSVAVYRHDAVWPSVALRKLVHDKIEVTDEDMRNGFENNYGPRVRCRAIVLDQLRRAQQVWEMARKQPTAEHFGDLAAEYSIEGSSRSLRGEVPPIARFSGQPVLEKEAFALKPGEMSGVIQMRDKYVILFCEGYTTPVKVEYAKVRSLLYDDIREKKQQIAMSDFFDDLQKTATIDNFLTGKSQTPDRAGDNDPDGSRLPTLRVGSLRGGLK
jgi:parvulin-like peptidyl-prolyl isomerase